MPEAEVNGRSIYHEVHGEGEPLVCVTGLGADSLSWGLQLERWSEHFRVVIFDNRDSGRSDLADADYEIADMAGDALALADHLELERFHLVGMSLGGAVAQELALCWPDRVRTLTLAVSWGGSGRWGAEFSRLWARQLEHTSSEEHVDNVMRLTLSEDFHADEERVEELRRQALENPNPQPTAAFVRQLGAMSRHEARQRLEGLEIPTHVIGAERDILVPVWKSRELAEAIPGARLTVIEGGAHALNLERAEELTDAVLDFLLEHSGD